MTDETTNVAAPVAATTNTTTGMDPVVVGILGIFFGVSVFQVFAHRCRVAAAARELTGARIFWITIFSSIAGAPIIGLIYAIVKKDEIIASRTYTINQSAEPTLQYSFGVLVFLAIIGLSFPIILAHRTRVAAANYTVSGGQSFLRDLGWGLVGCSWIAGLIYICVKRSEINASR
jgi:hypothetical protein